MKIIPGGDKMSILRYELSKPNPIPEEGIERAVELLTTGDLYRYNAKTAGESEVSMLEKEICEYTGAKYSLAVNSCGSGIYISLLALGVRPGDEVLMSAFTYTAVPSAIVNVGAKPVLLECTQDYTLDIPDLKLKINTHQKAKVLVISYMRGHISDVDEIMKICKENHIKIIEDCAHALGSTFSGIHVGNFGETGCFSTQSHKMINSGEGGFIISNDKELISKAILYSGTQDTFWKKHFIDGEYCSKYQELIPNISSRMSNLTAAIVRSQLKYVDKWNCEYVEKYNLIAKILENDEIFRIPVSNEKIYRGPDTIQFIVNISDNSKFAEWLNVLSEEGISVKCFGVKGNPRYYKSWKYIEGIKKVSLEKTDTILKRSCDLRLPLWLTMKEVEDMARFIVKKALEVTE